MLHLIKVVIASSDSSMQDVLNGIAERANPSSLMGLAMLTTNSDSIDEQDIPFDLGEGKTLDISPLLSLRSILAVNIDTEQGVQLKPDDAYLISKQWPQLVSLEVGGRHPCRYIPLIDHSHVIAILEGCHQLEFLGLHFDTSRLTAQDRSTKAPFRLQKLELGDSPIYSPSRVLAFLKANFTSQFTLGIYQSKNGQPSIFERRWIAVQDDWESSTFP